MKFVLYFFIVLLLYITIVMNPQIWGPPAWFFLESVVKVYPEHPSELEKQHYKDFFENLGNVLPCSACSNNYKIHLQKMPLTPLVLSSRANLVKWLIDIHNEVNRINNKKLITYEYFENKYKEMYSLPNKLKSYQTHTIILYIIIIILIILSVYLYYKK
jgi:hypothetical protein